MTTEEKLEILKKAVREMMNNAGDTRGRDGEYIDEIGRKALKEINQ